MADAKPTAAEVVVSTPPKAAPKKAPKAPSKEDPRGVKVKSFGHTFWIKG